MKRRMKEKKEIYLHLYPSLFSLALQRQPVFISSSSNIVLKIRWLSTLDLFYLLAPSFDESFFLHNFSFLLSNS